MTSWIFGAVAIVFALLGVVLASRAIDIGMATFGIGLVVFGVLFAFWLMKDHYDQRDGARPRA
jgi:hypothetical protein